VHHLWVLAALDQGRAEGVAQAVEGEPLVVEPGLLRKRFVFPVVVRALLAGPLPQVRAATSVYRSR
jgi:hypothetical protein